LKVRSRWREAHLGVANYTGPRIEVTEMAEQTCTERALRRVTGLKMFAEAPEDAGKQVRAVVVLKDGSRKTFTFTLLLDGWAAVDLPVRQIVSVSLPSGRCGPVILAQTDGYQLSIYAPHEVVPLYRKYRVKSQCRSGVLLLQGVKRFVPVAFDHDVVEVGSRSVLQAAGSMIRFRSNTTDAKSLNRATFDESQMGKLLLGLHARHRGNAIQDINAPRSGRVSKPLPGYQ
jgi:hypothetical protein